MWKKRWYLDSQIIAKRNEHGLKLINWYEVLNYDIWIRTSKVLHLAFINLGPYLKEYNYNFESLNTLKTFYILWKYFYSLAPIFVVFTKCIDPWVLEFIVSNTTGNNKWGNCISLDFYFRGISGPRNQWKLEPQD